MKRYVRSNNSNNSMAENNIMAEMAAFFFVYRQISVFPMYC